MKEQIAKVDKFAQIISDFMSIKEEVGEKSETWEDGKEGRRRSKFSLKENWITMKE